jgi:selenocysteine lyase/cysteine desulfurase
MGEAHFRIRHILEANLDAFRISTHIFNDENELKRFGEFLRGLSL